MTKSEIVSKATEWSAGHPEICAEIAVELERLHTQAYKSGFLAGHKAGQKFKSEVKS